MNVPILDMRGYSVSFDTDRGRVDVLKNIDLVLQPGEVLGLVGESGSGKTTLANTVMRNLPGSVRESGSLHLSGEDLLAMSERRLSQVRGRRIGMIFQDPATSLNPTMKLGRQVAEVLMRHRRLGRTEAWQEGIRILAGVGLKTPEALMERYPHEVSGGEKQRVVIAAAFACEPQCLIFDEATTALDVITAAQILDLFGEMQARTGVASIYISHDLALVSRVARRVAVMRRGVIVEEGETSHVLCAPSNAYTRDLLASVPDPSHRRVHDDQIVRTAPAVLQVRDMLVSYGRSRLFGPKTSFIGARQVNFELTRGEILGIVGESGSGKSTVARALAGLQPYGGEVAFEGHVLASGKPLPKSYRRSVQMIFQHPDASLNPRQRIGDILARPLLLYGLASRRDLNDRIASLLESVQLPAVFAQRYPHQLSGGQKQRVAIARAFASEPKVVICDEITASLDVSVQAAIVELLLALRDKHQCSYLFITHDLNLVREIAHRILVMYRSDLVETVDAAQLPGSSRHDYTQRLLRAVPTLARAPSSV